MIEIDKSKKKEKERQAMRKMYSMWATARVALTFQIYFAFEGFGYSTELV